MAELLLFNIQDPEKKTAIRLTALRLGLLCREIPPERQGETLEALLAGEAADKVKKILRDKGGYASEEDRTALVKELGDVLWYVANVARYLGVSLSDVAEGNIEKLSSRKKRNKLHGEGDER